MSYGVPFGEHFFQRWIPVAGLAQDCIRCEFWIVIRNALADPCKGMKIVDIYEVVHNTCDVG